MRPVFYEIFQTDFFEKRCQVLKEGLKTRKPQSIPSFLPPRRASELALRVSLREQRDEVHHLVLAVGGLLDGVPVGDDVRGDEAHEHLRGVRIPLEN